MSKNSHRICGHPTSFPPHAALVAAVVLCACGGTAEDETAEVGEASAPLGCRSQVYDPDRPVLGRGYGEWAEDFWQRLLPFPLDRSPLFDATGTYGHLGQRGPVWLLAAPTGQPGEEVHKRYHVRAGKVLFVPILQYLNDYPCPDPSFHPAPGQSLEDFLTQGAREAVDLVHDVSASIDGAPLAGVSRYRRHTDLFRFRADPSLQAIDACITGRRQPGVSDGYFFLVRPLPPGEHTIHVAGQLADVLFVNTTFHVSVGW